MKEALEDVNTHSFNNFKMRIGICNGSLVGGVIGAKKPVYDIFGDTVNLASRMDSTGVPDRIQVPKWTADILKDEGYRLEYRGPISVKGKESKMETFFVLGRKIDRASSLTKSQYAAKNTMTEVISGMVEVRRKQALSTSLSVPSPSNKSMRKQIPHSNPSLVVPPSNGTPKERYNKRNQPFSASFRFRKSPTPHRLNRMMSEMSNVGRGRSASTRKPNTSQRGGQAPQAQPPL